MAACEGGEGTGRVYGRLQDVSAWNTNTVLERAAISYIMMQSSSLMTPAHPTQVKPQDKEL